MVGLVLEVKVKYVSLEGIPVCLCEVGQLKALEDPILVVIEVVEQLFNVVLIGGCLDARVTGLLDIQKESIEILRLSIPF